MITSEWGDLWCLPLKVIWFEVRKTDKKIDNKIIQALTIACEEMLQTVEGFKWLTHTVDFKRVSNSLQVICVFDNELALQESVLDKSDHQIKDTICLQLKAIEITLDDVERQIIMLSESDYKNTADQRNKRLN